MDELHVVYGTGPTGLAVIEELLARGKRVRAVNRRGVRGTVPTQAEVVAGDATDPRSTRATSTGASHVYNCTNAPDYHKWPVQFPPLQRGILEGAAANDARLIVLENLYMYGPHGGVPLSEELPLRGVGLRSTTRRLMTEELWAAHRSGKVQALSARASDLFGPHVGESLAGERLFGPVVAGKPLQLWANPDVPHSLTYIADLGRALVNLALADDAYGQAWHIPNAPTVTLREFATIAYEEAGHELQISAVPRPVMRALLPVLGLAVPPVRGLRENLYIAYEPYIVDHSKYERRFGNHATPLREAIRTTVEWYQTHATQAHA
jgi:nucleoside-diphosphate-sugar epimerase